MTDQLVTLIYGIDGGFDGLVDDPLFGPQRGWLWRAFPGEEVVSMPEHPVELEVIGYPEPRDFNDNSNRPVTVRLWRRGPAVLGNGLILEVVSNLADLTKKPTIVSKSI